MAYEIIFGDTNFPIGSDGSYGRNETGTDIIVRDTSSDEYYTIPKCCSNNYMTVWYGNGVYNDDIINALLGTDIDFRNINEGEFVSSVDTSHYNIYSSYNGTCYVASFGARNANAITLVPHMFEDIPLSSISLPCNITEIPDYMFCNSSLRWINIPSTVVTIGNNAFEDCNILEDVKFNGNNLGTIDEKAFAGCNALPSIVIPDSVTSIGSSGFSYCTSLTSCTLSNSLTSIEENLFRNCSSLETISIPNSVTSIGDSAFTNCTGLESVTTPDNVTTMGEAIFSGCTSLTAATIGDGMTRMTGSSTFEDCTSLKSVDFGSNITSLGGSGLLSGCTALTDIYLRYNGGVVNTSQYLIDRNIASGVTLHVPSSLENDYKNSMVWTQVAGFDANNIVGDL
jgi:hypothetical protein